MLLVLELLAGQFVARPNRILRPSRDPDLIYESTPGTWLGHATADVWRAPLYMVLDLINTDAISHPTNAPPPPGYTLYRIDQAGCRAASTGPIAPTADVIILGSSQTFGLLVPAEDTVPAMLESSLRQRGFQGVRVGNCGVIGQHLVQTLRTAEIVRQAKRPRLVVTLVRPWHMTEQFDYTKVLAPPNRLLRVLVEHSNLARLIFYLRSFESFNKPLVPDAVIGAKLDRYLQSMAQDNVRSLFFLLDDGTRECAVFDGLTAMLQQRGIPVERIWTPGGEDRSYFVDRDRHWSVRGATVTTAEMVTAVARELNLAHTRRPPTAAH
jgi:hypothetical protein